MGYGPMGLALTRGVLSRPDVAQLVGVAPWQFSEQSNLLARLGLLSGSSDTLVAFLQHHAVPIVPVRSVHHFKFVKQLVALQPDVVLVGSWGEILKPHVLNLDGIRFINCHPSLLPRHRGPNPYTAAILQGEAQTGITFHEIDAGIDTGPILLQADLAIQPTDTGGDLRQRCAALAQAQCALLLEQLHAGACRPQPQDPEQATYDRIRPEIAWIHWEADMAALDCQMRGLYPWFEPVAQCRTYQVAFQRGRLLPLPAGTTAPKLPGTILTCSKRRLLAATSHPGMALELERPRLVGLPCGLGTVLRPFLLRPGNRFTMVPPGFA